MGNSKEFFSVEKSGSSVSQRGLGSTQDEIATILVVLVTVAACFGQEPTGNRQCGQVDEIYVFTCERLLSFGCPWRSTRLNYITPGLRFMDEFTFVKGDGGNGVSLMKAKPTTNR